MKAGLYFDFHSHILPGVDDGAKDWEMTGKMLEEAWRQGVSTMIATPHNYPGKTQDSDEIRTLCKKAEQIAKQIDPSMRVLPGNEIFFRWNLQKELLEGNILSMADSPYLLIEFSPGEDFERIYRGLKEVIECGYYPIIAHVERVHDVFFVKKNLEALIRMGCYMQANCEDFMGGPFDPAAAGLKRMLNHGKIHFLGSDCHNLSLRPPLMEDCIQKLKKKISKPRLYELIQKNPERFMEKKYI